MQDHVKLLNGGEDMAGPPVDAELSVLRGEQTGH